MRQVFAKHAWLGPGRFVQRVLVEFDRRVKAVWELRENEQPKADAMRVEWLAPGFVNAHCHLEYSWLEGAGLPRGPVPFGEWMRAITSRRPAGEDDLERRAEAMREGAQRLLAGGCTSIIDSTTDGNSAAVLQAAGLRHFLFYEVLGLTRERAEPIWKKVGWPLLADTEPTEASPEALLGENTPSRWQRCPAGAHWLLGTGLNPHAPYSVGEWLRERLKADESAAWPQAWHLAETPDEEELFRSGTGSIADFFRQAGLPMPWAEAGTWQNRQVGRVRSSTAISGETAPSGPGRSAQATSSATSMRWNSSFDFLRDAGQLEQCDLVFHGNELSREDAQFFRAPRGIVHCPGTHRWFDRGPVPLRQWLDAGVNVCLGTDSLASADTLSMLDVVRMTLEDHPDLLADEVLTMACTNPWRLEFLESDESGRWGAIEAGAAADLVAMKTTGAAAADLEEQAPLNEEARWRKALLNTGGCVTAVWIDGIQIDLSGLPG